MRMKLSEADVHKNTPNDCEFRENRRGVRHTSLRNGLLFSYFPHSLPEFCESLYKISVHTRKLMDLFS